MFKNVNNIPEGWEVKTLKDIGTFSKGSGITKNDIIEKGYPCVRYAELYTKYNFLIKTCYSFISEKTSMLSKKISYGDILFAGSGETREEIGKCCAYVGDTAAYAGGDTIILSPQDILNSIFASYYLNTSGRRQLNPLGQGYSVVHIYADHLKKTYIYIPPISEQKRIAEVLGCWDEGIEELEKVISLKEQQKKWLMQRLFKIKDSWNMKRFDDVFSDYCKKIIHSKNCYPLLRKKV